MKRDDSIVMITWHTNPLRGDRFEDAWRPAAAAAIDYGASYWALLRSKDYPLDFVQLAAFATKTDFERYWYSEEVSEARAEGIGLYQIPVVPQWLRAVDAGRILPDSELETEPQT